MKSYPSAWPEVSLGDICEFKYGKSLPDGLRAGGDVPVFGSNGRVGFHNEAITQGPSIIVGRKGSFGEINLSPVPCWPIDTTYYIDVSATKADLKWLAYRLSGLGLSRLNRAAAIPGLNRGDAYRKRLLLPPLEEQRRLAAILDQAEALRAKRRAALGQLDTLVQSIFIALLGDPWTNPNRVKRATLSEVTTRITDGTHLTPQFIDCGVPFIFVKNIENGEIDFRTDKFIREDEHEALYRRCPIEAGDILYTIVGATYGQAAPVGTFTKFAFQRHIAHLKPDPSKILPEFLSIVMQLPFVKTQADRWARGAAQPTINLKELREFEILLPSLKLQQHFVQRAAAVQKLKSSYRTSLREMDALFASLQHRAFRGEL